MAKIRHVLETPFVIEIPACSLTAEGQTKYLKDLYKNIGESKALFGFNEVMENLESNPSHSVKLVVIGPRLVKQRLLLEPLMVACSQRKVKMLLADKLSELESVDLFQSILKKSLGKSVDRPNLLAFTVDFTSTDDGSFIPDIPWLSK